MNFFDTEIHFFLGGDGIFVFTYKLTRNPNLTKSLLFWGGWGWRGGGV